MFCWVESWAPCAQPERRLAVSKSSCTWVRAARTGPAHLQRNGCHQRSCPGRSRAAERAEVVTRVRVLQASSRVRVLLSPVRKSYRSTQRGEGAQQDSGSVTTPKRVADRCSYPPHPRSAAGPESGKAGPHTASPRHPGEGPVPHSRAHGGAHRGNNIPTRGPSCKVLSAEGVGFSRHPSKYRPNRKGAPTGPLGARPMQSNSTRQDLALAAMTHGHPPWPVRSSRASPQPSPDGQTPSPNFSWAW